MQWATVLAVPMFSQCEREKLQATTIDSKVKQKDLEVWTRVDSREKTDLVRET